MNFIKILLITLLLTESGFASAGEFAVIGTNELYPQTLSDNQVVDIFMGRMKRLPNGAYIIPVDIQSSNPLRSGFYKQFMDKSLTEINSYWARLVFSGRGVPPRQADSVKDIIEIIKHNKGAIGYIPMDSVTEEVHVLYRVSQ